MLDFPFQLESVLLWQTKIIRNPVRKYRLSGPHFVLISGCGNLFWIQLQVENPSLAEQPERPLLPIPQLCCWDFGLVRMELKLFSPRSVQLSRWLWMAPDWPRTEFQWPWDLPAQTKVLVLCLLPLLLIQGLKEADSLALSFPESGKLPLWCLFPSACQRLRAGG